ncbi:hypothetical protein KX928_00590 [Roseobacter sp. YSTF-M11]|uniref:Beta-lactamase hydrolase-like protein phosphatase-like domain-containing protein n=1 Tax=Roseobacter insulae TaxID=2859783 RepID=A0A9X1JWU5_9RHOB|nr:hypothetical protein [Roseobacter insulae]
MTAQISTDDLPLIHALGFRSVMCNRPDGETQDQQLFAAIAQAADNVEMVSCYLPVPREGPSPETISSFLEALDTLPKPILAYCASGERSKRLFEKAHSEKSDTT